MRRLLIPLLLLLPAAAAALEPFEASYRLLHDGELKGETRFILRLHDSGYRFQAITRPAGEGTGDHQVLEASQGHFDGDRPEPDAYYYAVKENGRTRMAELFFDWEKMELTLRHDQGQEKYRLEEGTQDRLSYLLRAMALAAGPRAQAAFPRVGVEGTERLLLHEKRQQQLETPAGRFLAREVVITPEEGSARRHLWLAVREGWLPLLLERHRDDGVVRMELVRIHR